MKTRSIILAAVALLLAGCSTTYYKDKDVTVIRFALGTDQQLGHIDLQTGKDGNRIKVGGAKTGQSAAAGTITEGIVKGLKPTVIP